MNHSTRREFLKTTAALSAISFIPALPKFENKQEHGEDCLVIQAWKIDSKTESIWKKHDIFDTHWQYIRHWAFNAGVFISCDGSRIIAIGHYDKVNNFRDHFGYYDKVNVFQVGLKKLKENQKLFQIHRTPGWPSGTVLLDPEHKLLTHEGKYKKYCELSLDDKLLYRAKRKNNHPLSSVIVYRNPKADSVGAGKVGFLV